MTNDKLNSNDQIREKREEINLGIVHHSGFDIPSSFVISISSFCLPVECRTIVVV
jgi:hypothetical protein